MGNTVAPCNPKCARDLDGLLCACSHAPLRLEPARLERTEEFGAEIMKLCVEVGGALTGEPGLGVEKRDLMPVMLNEDDLNQQQRVKCAFDPTQILNPRNVFPKLHRCAELGRLHVRRGQVRFPDLPRL